MKQSRLLLVVPCFALLAAVPTPVSAQVRVACVGTSITFGAGVDRRETESYPAQLQQMLGDGYNIRNFGRNSATLLRSGDLPYTAQGEFRDALRFLPQVVFVELGTNDSKPRNRVRLDSFENDYFHLIEAFVDLSPRPRIVLLLPPPVFSDDTSGITDAVIRDRIIPTIREVSYKSGLEVVNLYNLFLDSPGEFPDRIHPSARGAERIARRLQEFLTMRVDSSFDFLASAGIRGDHSGYYGFDCCDFTFAGRSAKVVCPKKVAHGRPWIWRARFWGHEPQTEIALLERGFHLVYCDVAELFANAEALDVWDRFYTMLVRAGLAKKSAFIGFSRGGVYMYRWAAQHPDCIACVYADAPVLDLKSWPGGKGKGHGNPEEWERFKRDFGLNSEEEAMTFRGNPIDMVDELARAEFPMLHVCGDADVTVPIEENTDRFEKEILQRGGDITVIRKPGIGHHPHSLKNPQIIVNFILKAYRR